MQDTTSEFTPHVSLFSLSLCRFFGFSLFPLTLMVFIDSDGFMMLLDV